MRSEVEAEPVTKVRYGAPSEVPALLEDRDRAAATGQVNRGSEAGDATTYNDDVLVHGSQNATRIHSQPDASVAEFHRSLTAMW